MSYLRRVLQRAPVLPVPPGLVTLTWGNSVGDIELVLDRHRTELLQAQPGHGENPPLAGTQLRWDMLPWGWDLAVLPPRLGLARLPELGQALSCLSFVIAYGDDYDIKERTLRGYLVGIL